LQASALSQLLGPIMAQAFNQGSPTLRTLLAGKPATGYSVNPKSSILVAGMMMAEKHKAALVVEDERLIGIVAFKDIVTRVIAKELPLEHTEVSAIMTPDPEYVTPDTSIIEAMQIMHDSKFLTLPVCEENGAVCGVVDIMDLIYGAGGVEGWRSIFDSALDMDDGSETRSIYSSESRSVYRKDRAMPLYQEKKQDPVIHVMNSPYASAVLNNVPVQVEFNEGDQVSMGDSLLDRTLSYPITSPDRAAQLEDDVAFKIVDSDGHKYVVRCDAVYSNLLKAIAGKIDDDVDEKAIRLKFIDEEGDAVNISSDDCLAEAITTARKSGNLAVKLMLTIVEDKSKSIKIDQKTLAMVGGGFALALGLGAMTFLKPKA
jgi:CBS domain-containing protein